MSITLNDVRGASDPLRGYNFEFTIPVVPGGGASDIMRILCTDASMPPYGVHSFASTHYGFVIKHPGIQDFPRILQITYEEDNNLDITLALRAWKELLFQQDSGVQVEAKVYGTLNLLDLTRTPINTITFRGLYIERVEAGALNGGDSKGVALQATFSYDDHVLGGALGGIGSSIGAAIGGSIGRLI